MIKLLINTAIFILSYGGTFAQAHITGRWQTIDDSTGEIKSIVQIGERNGKVYGKIVKLYLDPGENPDPVCEECDRDDPRYGKSILGMEIFNSLTPDADGYSGGEILDPESGKEYRCRIWREGENLKVRGYWGPFFRTQEWQKAP